jgi:hypothetical protein
LPHVVRNYAAGRHEKAENSMRALILSAALAALAACQTPTPEPVPMPTPTPSAACAVIESRDWSAWINRMPGPNATPTLHVTGKVDLPNPGYSVTVRDGPADRSAQPVQQIILETSQRSGMFTQAVITADVHYTGPVIAPSYRAIRIMCGGRQIAEITEIPDVH